MIDNYKDEIIPRKGSALYKDFFACFSSVLKFWYCSLAWACRIGKISNKTRNLENFF